MRRAGKLDRPRKVLELGRERLQFTDQEAALTLGGMLRGFDQCLEHHGDARQDRFLDPLERLFKA
jgi:hypothetical protein